MSLLFVSIYQCMCMCALLTIIHMCHEVNAKYMKKIKAEYNLPTRRQSSIYVFFIVLHCRIKLIKKEEVASMEFFHAVFMTICYNTRCCLKLTFAWWFIVYIYT